jgi:hypothetical protein
MRTNKTDAFRNMAANQGIEMTPDEAADAYKALKKFVKRAKKMSLKDIWEVARHNQEYAELYMRAKEV